MTKKKNKKQGKNLPARDLQIQILRFLLAHPKKKYTARQVIDHLDLANSKDSVHHALTQLAKVGSASTTGEGKFGVELDRLTTDDLGFVPKASLRENSDLGFADSGISDSNFGEETPGEEIHRPKKVRSGVDYESKLKNPKAQRPSPKFQDEAYEGYAPKSPAIPKPNPIRESRNPKSEIQNPNSKNPKSEIRNLKLMEGRMDMTRTGSGYVVSELQETDIFIAPKHMGGALNGDVVRVELFPKRQRRRGDPERKPEGKVIQIVERATEFFIGTLRKSRKYALFLPDNPLIPTDIYVALEDCAEAKDGDKVVVKVSDWQTGKGRVPIGKVTSVLGAVGGHDFEMKKILINAGFEIEHTPEAEAEAANIPDKISPMEIEMRRDFRDVLTFTIDPIDAKDFDDALSIRELENGNLEIGVHIADVTHYLKPDSSIDKEAFKRSTSVYLVDRVAPMLPEKLSNNLCSLVPHQDRLTFSAVFVFDKKDKITSRWFGKTVIHSAHRFSYEQAQTILEGSPEDSLRESEIFPKLEWALKTLNRLAKKMRVEREKNGSIGFETEEVRFRLELDGTPIEAYVKDRKDAHLLIEDFMLLANKEVALFIDEKGKATQEIPFVYRIHDLPDMEKVAEFARFALEMGHKMKIDTPKQIAQSYNDLMKAAQKDERLKLLEPLAIRTMAKAVYSPDNIGHYGLGFSHYSHFTSPIRRYSDVLAHRILERNLDGKTFRVDKNKLTEQCKHISAQEKKAADAERESVKLKQAELTQKQIGQVFRGTISGMVERGFFVELPGSKAEGMVSFRDLADTYIISDGNFAAKGRRYGHVFKMGDKVDVRVISVDLQRRQIELEFSGEEF